MPGLATPVPPHAARIQHLLHIVDHRRLSTEHRVRVLRRKGNSRARFEAPVFDGRRDAARQRRVSAKVIRLS